MRSSRSATWFTSIFSCLLLSSSALHAQNAVTTELGKNQDYQNALKALKDKLPAQAVTRFQAALQKEAQSDAAKKIIGLKLVEAYIRANQGGKAHALLQQDFLKALPEAHYWRGQVLPLLGQLPEAKAEFALATKIEDPHIASLAWLSKSSIERSTRETDAAIHSLQSAIAIKHPKTVTKARLQLAEVFLAQQLTEKADATLKAIEATPNLSQRDKDLHRYLTAQIQLSKGDFITAEASFLHLTTKGKLPDIRLQHACIVGLADSYIAQQKKEAATRLLLKLVNDSPDTPLLQRVFQRLLNLSDTEELTSQIITQLKAWKKDPTPRSPEWIIGTNSDSILALDQLRPHTGSDREAFTLYGHAVLLSKSNDPKQLKEAQAYLSQLRLDYPYHFLYSRSLIITAQILIQLEKTEVATKLLNSILQTESPADVKQESFFLLGEIEANKGNLEAAKQAFNKATTTLGEVSTAATINEGLAALRTGNLKAFEDLTKDIDSPQLKQNLLYESALWAAANNARHARFSLDDFIRNYPVHPNHLDAVLTLAEHAVSYPPYDLVIVADCLKRVGKKQLSDSQKLSLIKTKIQVALLNQNAKQAKSLAATFIESNRGIPRIEEVQLKLGELFYQNGDFNKARQIFNELIKQFADSPLAEYAEFFSAMAAVKEATPQSREEAIKLFSNTIKRNGNMRSEAVIQQARLLLDVGKASEAADALRSVYASEGGAAQRNIGTLLADALYRLHDEKTTATTQESPHLKEAIAIYDTLLKAKDLSPSWSNRLYYLKGQTLEKADSSGTQALDQYYKVVNLENLPAELKAAKQPAEWHWYYRCGFRAVSILEEQKQWRTAVNILRKIADTQGPRAAEADEKARKLSMKHFIWK